MPWSAETFPIDALGAHLCASLMHFHERPPRDQDAAAISLSRQARHLLRTAGSADVTCDHLDVWRGAVAVALYLAPFQNRLTFALNGLKDALPRLVHPDGGHWQRDPARHLRALAQMIELRQWLRDTETAVPPALKEVIHRMTPMLRAYRLGDGGLAAFNGGGCGDVALIERVLELSGSATKAVSSAPHTGFHRLAAQRTRVVMDTGAPVHGNAGTLAFEVSAGKQRLIVNCGGGAHGNPALTEALRASVAHSTLTIANTNSSELSPIGSRGGGFGTRRVQNVEVRRREQDRNVLVEGSHDGYLEPFGLMHRRALYLSRDGLDLRGEDVVEAESVTDHVFHIRFHLHPLVQASLIEGGGAALLRLPSGRGWRISVSHGTLALEDSLYTGDGQARKNQQLVVESRHAKCKTIVKWRLAREG